MIPFAPCMFPNQVRVRPAKYPPTNQGGANPIPSTGTLYAASVQDQPDSNADPQEQGTYPQSCLYFRVYISRDPADTLIPSLLYGDQIEWVDGGGLVFTVLGPARNRGGYDVLWRIDCQYIK